MKRMREYREKAGLSRREVAAKTGLSQRAIDYIEDGVKSPSVENAVKIADALGCTLLDLLDDTAA
jgi:transcriptional regulator with XRE-family HTH domain